MVGANPLGSLMRTWNAPGVDPQERAAIAVVIPTILRPSVVRALQSVFAQEFAGRVQILIGIDKPAGTMELLESTCALAPSHCCVQLLYPGYSTSVRHGGPWAARDGGTLRTILSYLANAPLIAYLDDDNWWGLRHLDSLARAIDPVDWAFSLRWFVHPDTARPVCVDQWESVGPDAGIFRERFGGFVDPNCLMIKREPCAAALPLWTIPLPGDEKAMSADRTVFNFLSRERKFATSGAATCFYVVDPTDGLHPLRLQAMGTRYQEAGADVGGGAI